MKMPDNARQKRRYWRGYTMTETMVAMTVTLFMFTGMFSILSTAARCFDNTNKQVNSDYDAAFAMQMIVQDVREAKTITISSGTGSNQQLRVTTPKIVGTATNPYYNRYEPNLTSQIDFYLSDSSGVQGRAGTYLWRSVTDGTKSVLRKDVSALDFEQDSTRSVAITITTANGSQQANLMQRVVYLRNY